MYRGPRDRFKKRWRFQRQPRFIMFQPVGAPWGLILDSENLTAGNCFSNSPGFYAEGGQLDGR